MPIRITSSNRIYGSVVYEEVGSDDMVLEFFTSRFGSKGEESGELEYPQQPLAQEWIVDYPLLVYKHFSPENKQICVVHLA